MEAVPVSTRVLQHHTTGQYPAGLPPGGPVCTGLPRQQVAIGGLPILQDKGRRPRGCHCVVCWRSVRGRTGGTPSTDEHGLVPLGFGPARAGGPEGVGGSYDVYCLTPTTTGRHTISFMSVEPGRLYVDGKLALEGGRASEPENGGGEPVRVARGHAVGRQSARDLACLVPRPRSWQCPGGCLVRPEKPKWETPGKSFPRPNRYIPTLYSRRSTGGKQCTFPRRIQDTPAYHNWPGENGQAVYSGGLYLGCRARRRRLVAFEKVWPGAGETKHVGIVMDKYAMGYYDTGVGAWVAEEGRFEVLVGASSTDIR